MCPDVYVKLEVVHSGIGVHELLHAYEFGVVNSTGASESDIRIKHQEHVNHLSIDSNLYLESPV